MGNHRHTPVVPHYSLKNFSRLRLTFGQRNQNNRGRYYTKYLRQSCQDKRHRLEPDREPPIHRSDHREPDGSIRAVDRKGSSANRLASPRSLARDFVAP